MNNNIEQVGDTGEVRLSEQSLTNRVVKYTRQKGHFIKGPIPLAWLTTAIAIQGKSLNVAMALWYKHGIVKGDSFTASHKLLKRFGVKRHASGRILKEMAIRGLIQLDQGDGMAPRVKVLPDGGPDSLP